MHQDVNLTASNDQHSRSQKKQWEVPQIAVERSLVVKAQGPENPSGEPFLEPLGNSPVP